MLRDGPFARMAALRDLNFGPLSEALTRQDRERLRRSLRNAAPDLRAQRPEVESDLAQLLAVLRAPEFRRDDVAALFLRYNDRALQRQKLGQDLLLDLLAAMPPDARAAFADRLETTIRRGKKAAAP
ncbi:MAG: periplasmic heavy metal sensor [Pseudomonadota bacterium]